ncbi:MAG: DUF1573 domain-containing protein, partial [bacterium]
MKDVIVSMVIALLVGGVVLGLAIKFSQQVEPPASFQAETARTDTSAVAPSEPTASLTQPASKTQVQPPELPESKPAPVKPDKVKSESIPSPESKPEKEKPPEKKEKIAPEVEGAKIKTKAQPDIHFEELSHNFGEIGQGVQVTHVFKFKNRGDTDLYIEETKASCGCTAALLSSKIITPGDTGEVKVTFNSGKFKGPQSKSIYVTSNDPDEAKVTLEIAATVKTPITLKPERLVFGKVKIGEKVSQEVEIKLETEGKLEIQRVETEVDYI